MDLLEPLFLEEINWISWRWRAPEFSSHISITFLIRLCSMAAVLADWERARRTDKQDVISILVFSTSVNSSG